MHFIELKEINSTNFYSSELIKNKIINQETIVFAYKQTDGKGLGNNKWLSEPFKNILMSIITFLEIRVTDFFKLNLIVSLAVIEYLKLFGVKAKIKWPNDIYVNNQKICGILIENNISGNFISSSIIGIGLNVNQVYFDESIPNPVSLKIITGIDYNIKEQIKVLGEIVLQKIKQNKNAAFEILKNEYLKVLFLYNEYTEFQDNSNKFKGKIIDIENNGHIVIEKFEGDVSKYFFKEVKFL
ncbi:MAG: biotin--[acetyl-CoA-carboxylase] ligase [Bacteroidales bacterium]|jgi:BirA family biotin operon repressor/biotin-[acetyl-CoA-carboxylase] ligase|nr:biotin--[acetyl-CoA-carboxylase] ligase [Bacteroidales bacterium]HOL97343.1 biotin--[acetyl-CoA-carboxylase] ligase [Bacteroidales bacterium]HOM36074.1 biotin--[acetyl-CoA-carboxylase] ligase [Bacteroidales bacterium]HPD22909.1 biotin--[acetyl-CoA-carboxylase] ligase [Bacteroidales bacterium]HRS98577.1 biotin--[acetyl-CoA-carboxylase] ligase [Bacteroidales bacterium]